MGHDSLRRRLVSLLVLCAAWVLSLSPTALGVAKTEVECVVCGMKTTAEAKNSFESVRDRKPVHFCSFACAHRFHSSSAHRDAPLFARDFTTGASIDVQGAFFLAKSKNIEKELEFDMPPSVVAFASEQSARDAQARLKDGEVVRGFDALARIYK